MRIPAIAGWSRRAVRRLPWFVPGGRAKLVCLLTAALVLAGSGAQVAFARITMLPGDAVLRVYGTVVTKDDFGKRLNMLAALYDVQQPSDEAKRADFQRDAAKSLAVSLILDRAAQQRTIVVADKEASDVLDKIIQDQLPNGRDDFVQFLSGKGINEGDVLAELKRQLATSRLFDQVTANVKPVTDDEVRQAYQQRQATMTQPEQRRLRNIVVDTDTAAADILRQLQGGADFAALAQQRSLDASTKGNGGDLGTLSAAQLDKDYADAAFKPGKNGYFGPVKTQYGWNVGQVLDITPGRPLSFDDVKAQLTTDLNNEHKLAVWRAWLGDLIKNAHVEYAGDYRPADPDAPPAEQPTTQPSR